MSNFIIVVCGPTASGKTDFSIKLAKQLNTEIISADSMQVYKHMDIGTAKPTMGERRGIEHHMFDVVLPGQPYSVSLYEQQASAHVDRILAQNKPPIICGGTGLYINALISGTGFMGNTQSSGTREILEQDWDKHGGRQIHERLFAVDPISAQKLHVNDKKRIIRALEVFIDTGKPISLHNEQTKNAPPRYKALMLGLFPPSREMLYDRINTRVDSMIANGLIEETKWLTEQNMLVGTAAQAIGYKELSGYLNGQMSLEEATELLKRKSRNYAKRQLTWFGGDSRIKRLLIGSAQDIELNLCKATNFIKEMA